MDHQEPRLGSETTSVASPLEMQELIMEDIFKMIPIIYEDDWLVIVDKPAGLLVIPTPKNERRTLTNILNEDLKKNGLSYHLHPCHRLDRETSGLIIYAKGRSMLNKMRGLFKTHKIKKTYIAFVHGKISHIKGRIDAPIEGRQAGTVFKVLETRKDFSVVEVEPQTGRTNQIRIHFKSIGHPLVGEKRFALRRDFKLKANRLCLHAQGLEFVHPEIKKNLRVENQLPKALKNFLNKHSLNVTKLIQTVL